MGGRTNERHDYDGRRITRNTISTIIRLLSRSEKIVQLIIDYFVRGGDSFLIWVTCVFHRQCSVARAYSGNGRAGYDRASARPHRSYTFGGVRNSGYENNETNVRDRIRLNYSRTTRSILAVNRRLCPACL